MEDDAVARERFATTDPEVAEHFMRTTYVDQRLNLDSPAEDFRYELDALVAPGFAINRIRHSARMSLDVAPLDDLLVVDLVRSGWVASERSRYDDAATTAGNVGLVPPAGRSRIVMDDIDVDSLVLSQSDLGGYAAATWGLDPDRFEITDLVPVSAHAAEHCRATVRHVQQSVLASPAAARNRIIIVSAARLLSAAVLSTFPNTALAAASDPDTPHPRGELPAARLHTVVDYLHDHADEPIGPSEWATVAGAPAREVDAALRRHRGTTAARELWRARLRGAHRDLLAADAETTSVTDVALRWGFPRPAAFRVAYMLSTRGETPEQALRRSM